MQELIELNTKEINQRFPDLDKSYQALLRAAESARRLAEQTGTRLVVSPKSQPPAGKKPD